MYQEPKPTILSKKNDKRYSKIIDNIKSGKEKTIGFKTTKEMMNYLDNH